METKRIRIGNDIRLAVDLRQYLGGNNRNLLEREVYNPGDVDFENLDPNPYVNKDTELYYNGNNSTQSGSSSSGGDGSGITVLPDSASVCIRSVKAILINTTKQDEQIADLKNKSRFIGRFPIDPWMDAFRPNPYDIRCSGYYSWRVNPYCGFGLHPCWDALRKKAIPSIPTEYRAQVLATKKQNVVEDINTMLEELSTNKDLRQKLETFLHPQVWQTARKKLAVCRKPWVVFEVPLLFEAGWNERVDLTVLVSASPKTLPARLKARGISVAEYKQRRQAQWPEDEKIRQADLVIYNNRTKQRLCEQAARLYRAFDDLYDK